MPSLQARLLSLLIRRFVRRQSWGDDAAAVARRARRVFGAPQFWQNFAARNLRVTAIENGDVRGKWIEPQTAAGKTILYFHGGGYVSCSARTHRPITAALARLANCRVFALEYRLAPEHRFPAALDDAAAAYRWLLAQNIAAEKIAFSGDSAGGGMVFGALLRLRAANVPLPACAVCFSPWTDLTGESESARFNNNRCAMFYTANIKEFAAAYLGGETAAVDPLASFVFNDFHALPPIQMQVGSTELLLDDSRRVAEKIKNAGGKCELLIYDDLPHGWQMLDRLVPEARQSLRQAANFIRRNLA